MNAPIIVIGGGVNELVAAHWLARAGNAVVVLGEEARDRDAGLAPGWIPPAIIRDLDLPRHGLAVRQPDPWISVPLAKGGRLDLWQDIARSAASIRPLSARDADRWPAFCEQMHQHASVIEALYAAPPPDVMTNEWTELGRIASLALRARRLGRAGLESLLRMAPMSVADFLDDWFESDVLKGLLGAGGVMHLHQGPRASGTAFAFLHHHVGSPPGVFRPPQSNIVPVLEKRPGIERRPTAKVTRIAVEAGGVSGVTLDDGSTIATSCVISGEHPRRTLLDWVDSAWLEPEMIRGLRHIRARGVAARIHLTLDRPPAFSTLTIAPSLDYLERAYDDAKYRRVSKSPFIEARYAPPIAAAGAHSVSVHMQYAPYALADGQWDEARRQALGDVVFTMLAGHLPREAVCAIDIQSPADLQVRYGWPHGQAHHAELALDQLLWMRPHPSLARYRTPINGLYLCGPAMHPGAGIAGASGMLAAQSALHDRSK